MRAFIAIPLSEDGIRFVEDLQACLRQISSFSDFRWIPSRNVHLTLRFLGEISEKQVASAIHALDTACAGRPSFSFSLDQLGVFPRPRNPSVLWAGSHQPSEDLMTLAESLTRELDLAGFQSENRPFYPHLTLARRRRNARPLKGMREAIQEAQEKCLSSSATWRLLEGGLFRSELKSSGAVYHTEHRVPFGI
jgi:2'-5' RNA ligase